MFKKEFINLYLKNGFDSYEASSELDFALEILCGLSQTDVLIGKQPNGESLAKLKKIIEERVFTHKPLQQILGIAYFMGDKFVVNEHTLIPRPETEILVNECIRLIKQNNYKKILDIGSGSGCIDIMLMKNLDNIEIDSVDISEEALNIATQNAKNHLPSSKINFVKSDLFENISEKYDLILSNPPYIPISDKSTLEKEVSDYEPSLALFASDKDGIEFYEKIIESSELYLNKGGSIAFELGINQASIVQNLFLSKAFSKINIIKDLDSIERTISARK